MAYNVDLERARAERDFRQNPPSSAPGQGSMSDNNDWDNIFSNANTDSTAANDSALSGLDSNSMNGIGGGDLNAMLNPSQQGMQGQGMQGTQGMQNGGLEGLIETGLTAGGKYAVNLSKDIAASAKEMTFNKWVVLCRNYSLLGAIITGVGLFCWVCAVFAGGESYKATTIIEGGLLSLFIGGGFWWFLLPKAKRRQELADAEAEAEPPIEEAVDPEPDFSSFDSFDSFDSMDGDSDSFADEEGFPEDDVWGNFDDDYDDEEEIIEGPTQDNMDIEGALESMPEITKGTQTRSYLIETFTKVLPLMNPKFTQMKDISDTSDEFINFEQWIRDAAEQTGAKEENLPELTGLRENAFIYQILATRPTGLKEQEIADLIADTYSRDDYGRVAKDGVYATVDSSMGVLRINLFKGENVLISIGDVYRNISNWLMDSNNKMPVVWGIDEMGTPLYCDVYDMFSLIICGVPRGGKSWKGQSFLLQLMMFSSPKDVTFYFFDPKGKQSDYEYMSRTMPHCKGFVSDVHQITQSLQRIIDKEVPYRRKVLEESGEINIKEFKKKNPDVYMPYIYIVMDELMSMVKGGFTKEEKAEYDSQISVLCSQLPNLGFRLIMFPHRIVNEIISKSIYELVSCRCIVKSPSFSEIQSAIGVQRKDFPYNLVNSGDMGIRTPDINKGKPSYCHSEVITTENAKNQEVFKFVAEVWNRLEPDYASGIYDSLIQSTNISEKTTGGSYEKMINDKMGVKTVGGKNKPVRDNSIGGEYQYTGFDTEGATGVEGLADNVADVSEGEADESFWDDFLDD